MRNTKQILGLGLWSWIFDPGLSVWILEFKSMILGLGARSRVWVLVHSVVITKCDKKVITMWDRYYQVWKKSITKCDRDYKCDKKLLQSVTCTNYDNCYKVRRNICIIWRIRNPSQKSFTFRHWYSSAFIQRRFDYILVFKTLKESILIQKYYWIF